jgi:hypothetical protein
MTGQPEQEGIIERLPGSIPSRPPTMSELMELKFFCREARHDLEGVFGSIQTLNLGEDFENAAETMDDMGRLLDAITQYCQRSLKRMDDKKVKKI